VSSPYTSELAALLAPDALERFTRYARIDTQARRDRERCPSTPGQLELAHLLAGELRELGLRDAEVDPNGYLMATLPASGPEAEVIGLIAHLDTSPDAPGSGVEPIVHRAYDGGVIELPRGGTRLDPARMPELGTVVGHDLVSSSGDTLLGADDKAGVAAIMAAVAHLAAHPRLPRPTIRVGFTPDEEIGEGATLFDLDRFGARCAYTVDGSALGELQDESFSALEVRIGIDGVEAHPGQAHGVLVNALRLAARILAALPSDRLAPETSSGREGFIHPYSLEGGAAHAELGLIVRDFEEDLLEAHLALLRELAESVLGEQPGARMSFTVRRQYSNMRSFIERAPEIVAAAERALREEGIEPVRRPIRGGTDGSRLSELGLPCPNLFTGGHAHHSVREWVSVAELGAAAAVLVRLAGVWAATKSDSV
jgi:tripeptide aminopeptidase